jgi:hypothetical protein
MFGMIEALGIVAWVSVVGIALALLLRRFMDE